MKELWNKKLSPSTRLILQTGISATDVGNAYVKDRLVIIEKSSRTLRFPLLFDYQPQALSANAIRKRFYKETGLTIIESRVKLLTEISKIDPYLAENWLIQRGVVNPKRMLEVLHQIFLS